MKQKVRQMPEMLTETKTGRKRIVCRELGSENLLEPVDLKGGWKWAESLYIFGNQTLEPNK